MNTRRRFVFAVGFGALAPLATRAFSQQPATNKVWRIGIVEFGGPPDSQFVADYLGALRQLGYAESANLQVERRYARGNPDRFSELLQDLANQQVNLVFTVGNDIAQVAKKVVPGMSVVAAGSEDPVMSGLVANFKRPGGNITGVTYLSPQLAAKRLELLKEMLPGLARVVMLWDPTHVDTYYKDMEAVARSLGVRLQLIEVRAADEIEDAIATAQKGRAEALFIAPSRLMNLQSQRINRLALNAKLPTMAAYVSFTLSGGLMSYGAVTADMLRRAAAQTDKILKGAKAGDLPYEQAATFELVINIKTATALGIKIPQSILVQATKVIE